MQPLTHLGERDQAVDDIGSRRLLADRWRGVLLELVADLSDELLQHVLERHEARRSPVLVDHDRELGVLPPELRECLVEA